MLGPIIVSSIGIGLPIVAGLWLAPRRDGEPARSVRIHQLQGWLHSLVRGVGHNAQGASVRRSSLTAMSDAD
jgi:hypothetical protein